MASVMAVSSARIPSRSLPIAEQSEADEELVDEDIDCAVSSST